MLQSWDECHRYRRPQRERTPLLGQSGTTAVVVACPVLHYRVSLVRSMCTDADGRAPFSGPIVHVP